MNRKLISLILVLALSLTGLLSACSSNPANAESSGSTAVADTANTSILNEDSITTLDVYMSPNEESIQNVLLEIADDFSKQNPDIKVSFTFPGQEYENILKIKMASNELPDVFDTHGWAKVRYGEYLADLKDLSWTPNLTDSIKDVVTDENGKVYCLVLTEAKDGLVYNADVLQKYSIEIPKTIDELIAAGEKIKTESNGEVDPFYFSGTDSWMIGQFFDEFATSTLISPPNNQADALLGNTMDWDSWTPLAEKFKEMYDKGLMNEDVLTAKYSDLPQKFAEGKVAFGVMGLGIAQEVKKINPEVNMGMMPVPAWTVDDEPNFSGGERWTMGVWKDSPKIEAAKKLVDFFGQPENMLKIANVTKLPAGQKNIQADHEYAKYYEQYADIRVFPYFDRVYLPNGMWDVMCKSGTQMIAGQITPGQFSETMKSEVERLKQQ